VRPHGVCRRDLFKHFAQLGKIYRLCQMIIETCLTPAPDIIVFAVGRQSYAGETLSAFGFTNHFASAAVRQSEIADNRVEVFRPQECECAFDVVSSGNAMAEMAQQASEDSAGIAVILDYQNLQGHNSGKTSRGYQCLA
jgi:hypothetical protein